MPSSELCLSTGSTNPSAEGTYSLYEDRLRPAADATWQALPVRRSLEGSITACSAVARDMDSLIMTVLDRMLGTAQGSRDRAAEALQKSDTAAEIDVEYDVILPGQSPKRTRMIRAVVRREQASWPGLALAPDDLVGLGHGPGDA